MRLSETRRMAMAKGIKPPKFKACRQCKAKLVPRNTLQIVCSPSCAIKHAKQQSERKQRQSEASARREWNKRKADAKPLSHWISMTQRAFNDYIRARMRGVAASAAAVQRQRNITQDTSGRLRRPVSSGSTKTTAICSAHPAMSITPAQSLNTESI